MAGIWDSNFKHLVGANPEEFIRWLLPGAQYIRELSTHLNRGIDTDILYEVMLDGERIIFHLEFQRSINANMANRVLEYNVFASCKFDCTVVSFVIYLKAALAFDRQEDRDWLRRRFQMYQDILRDTEIYQIIMQEGVEKGIEKGIEKGVKKGHQQELQDLRQILMGFIQARFQELVPLATKQTARITDTEKLKNLTLKVGLAQSPEEARQLLLGAGKKSKN